MEPGSTPGIVMPPEQATERMPMAPQASLADLGQFQGALDRAKAALANAPDAIQPALEAVMETVKQIDAKGHDISATAEAAANSDKEMSP
ncbi:MAG: hypothetical protein AAGJ50_14160, partial [Pseudomonadota bacterium]